ncbi:hypothetical protein EJ04DRAFT_304601 [Polyplosphaeria fusca]|uniref:Uncharacterized protein n=1 Tax=Polyplosphaeria fusca TaxID=682080 RepID=A0A9P4QX28_9PLEO|nr:hypothetical protein EJ04DRAFT_304601 [Polyplosphaeria fusca]
MNDFSPYGGNSWGNIPHSQQQNSYGSGQGYYSSPYNSFQGQNYSEYPRARNRERPPHNSHSWDKGGYGDRRPRAHNGNDDLERLAREVDAQWKSLMLQFQQFEMMKRDIEAKWQRAQEMKQRGRDREAMSLLMEVKSAMRGMGMGSGDR